MNNFCRSIPAFREATKLPSGATTNTKKKKNKQYKSKAHIIIKYRNKMLHSKGAQVLKL